MSKLRAFAGVARAPFLLLPVTLISSGAASSAYEGSFSLLHTVVALAGLVSLHVAVNALNEASDFRSGIDLATKRTPFSGGSGTLPSGALSPAAARAFGLAAAAVGLAAGGWFLARIGWTMLPFLAVGLFFVLGYTDILARLGVGEVAAGLGLGALPVVGTALVQDGRIGPAAIAASVPAFAMTFNLLLLNEFPDEEADRAGGRRNLVTLLGRRGAARVYAAAAILTPSAVVAAVLLGALPWPCLAAAVPSLLAVRPVSWALREPESAVPLPALGANVAWNLATNSVLAAALVAATLAGMGPGGGP